MIDRTLFNEFRRSIDRLFEEFYGSNRLTSSEGSAEWTFSPTVETGWTNDYLNLRVIIPGVTEEDLKVTVQGNQLVIEGTRPVPEGFATNGQAYTRIPYGKFYRALDLPNGLELEKVSCHLHDGVLDIRIPVASAMRPRQIPIQAGEPRKAIAA